MFPKKLYDRLVPDFRNVAFDETLRVQILFQYIFKIMIPIVFVLSIINLTTERYTMGFLMLLLTAIYSAFHFVVWKYKEKGVKIVSILMSILTIFMCTEFLIHGTTEGIATIWLLILPILAFMLMGRRIGLICSMTMLIIIVFLLWTPMGKSLLIHQYSDVYLSRFPIVFFVMLLISLFYEIQRSTIIQEVSTQKERMEGIYENQYASMTTRIAEAKKVRHDMRHHFVMINQYLQDGNYDEASNYIDQYYQSLPFEESLTYCEHYATNALLTYYSQLAKNEGIKTKIQVNFPAELPVGVEDLTVIIGNLFENAVHACTSGLREDDHFQANIEVKGNFDGNMLMFTITNTSLHEARTDNSGRYISSKHEGHGIGICSVQEIAEKYAGNLRIEQTNGMFKANVMLIDFEK